ncbi:hypothetical protein FE257_009025 [Aspergillus nanangensis]|uniref:DUF7730 domain-containing protein n=1 Tax=Aspergillus nanangensis TaxID=2582783 RepID=A0AAD4CX21_ASPNN|nr:hypothetical protein FE257_009025 [Aspergillus nanangensis]
MFLLSSPFAYRTPEGELLPKPSWKDTPDALPEQRPRPLTPPLPDNNAPHPPGPNTPLGMLGLVAKQLIRGKPIVQHTCGQGQSPLLQLPVEIRLSIWEHYLGGHQLHIVRTNRFESKTGRGRLVGIKCGEDPEDFCAHDCWGKIVVRKAGCVADAVTPVEPRHYLGQFRDSPAEEINFVALLLTCRLIYTETVDILYGRNTFAFDHIDSIISLSRTVLPQRLEKIRSVRLTYHHPRPLDIETETHSTFSAACAAIGQMSKLEELTIHCHPRAPLMNLPRFRELYEEFVAEKSKS